MKRNWIWGLLATLAATGAWAFAQQEGLGTIPTGAGQAASAGASGQELPPVAPPIGTQPGAASIGPLSPSANTAPIGSDPFGLPTTIPGPQVSGQSGQPFAGAPTSANSVQAQGNSRNFGAGTNSASGFGAMGGQFAPNSRFGGGLAGGGFGGNWASSNNFTNMNLSKEARDYREAEASVQQIAARLRHTDKSDPAASKLKEDLKAAVTKAFEARQVQQAAEVKRLKEKLAEIEATVTRREKIKEDLILERISNLTSGGDAFGGFNDSPFDLGVGIPVGPSVFDNTDSTATEVPSANVPADTSPLPPRSR